MRLAWLVPLASCAAEGGTGGAGGAGGAGGYIIVKLGVPHGP